MATNDETVVLIAEDDSKTANLVASYLASESIASIIANDGKNVVAMFEQHRPQLVLLDIMLPRMNGLDVCTAIRRNSNVPILFLTARDDEVDKVLGLGIGGDDYIVKPFSPRELVARIKAHLRRSSMNIAAMDGCTENDASFISHGVLSFDVAKRRFTFNGLPLSLTPIEFTLLQTLMEKPGRVFLRHELLDKLYPDGELVVDRVIDVHIGKLRQKIGDHPSSPTFIHTVRGIGYRFSDPPK